MSDVVLATRNAASNYPLALENLAKRFRNNDDSEAINYKDVAFGTSAKTLQRTPSGSLQTLNCLKIPR